MYAIAIIGDLLSFIPVVNIVSGIVTGFLLWIAGEITGVQIFSGKGIGWTLLTIVVEETPGLSILPGWTVRVWLGKRQHAQEEGV